MKKIRISALTFIACNINIWAAAHAMEKEEFQSTGYDERRKMIYIGKPISELRPESAAVPIMENEESIMYGMLGLVAEEKTAFPPPVKVHSLPVDSIGTVLGESLLTKDDNGKVVDRRSPVEKPHKHPWHVHGHMEMDYGGGTKYIGSGTLIGNKYVITAGHNLYDRISRSIPNKITFFPGMKHRKIPYSSEADRIIFHPKYKVPDNPNFKDVDIGVIRLKESLGEKVGYFEIKALSKTELKDVKLNVTGYPGEIFSGTFMCTMEGPINDKYSESDRLYYDIDTTPGQSGSGAWIKDRDDAYRVVAVHTYGNDEGKNLNSGTWLNSAKAKLVQNWVNSLDTFKVESLDTSTND